MNVIATAVVGPPVVKGLQVSPMDCNQPHISYEVVDKGVKVVGPIGIVGGGPNVTGGGQKVGGPVAGAPVGFSGSQIFRIF